MNSIDRIIESGKLSTSLKMMLSNAIEGSIGNSGGVKQDVNNNGQTNNPI